jgi:peptidoglycan/LPS O-acetylase OafA/YrhL
LRIFPLFYATLLVAWLAGVAEVRDSLPWHLAYASNVYLLSVGDWHGNVSHFWSLAIEEQFYLVWPLVVLLTPRAALVPVLLATAASAIAFRAWAAGTGAHWIAGFVLPFGHMDSLAIGALPAVSRLLTREGQERARARLRAVALCVALPLVAGLWLVRIGDFEKPLWIWGLHLILENSAWALTFAVLVDAAACGIGGRLGRVLELNALTYLGTISYGLYVLHPFVESLVRWACAQAELPYPGQRPAEVLLLLLVTVLLAAASWHFFERPVSLLKRHFPLA